MDIMGFLTRMWEEHRNASIGVILGLLVGVCFASFGFAKTLVVLICIAIGLIIGKVVDAKGGWSKLWKSFNENE